MQVVDGIASNPSASKFHGYKSSNPDSPTAMLVVGDFFSPVLISIDK